MAQRKRQNNMKILYDRLDMSQTKTQSLFKKTEKGVVFNVFLMPCASKDEILSLFYDENEEPHIKISVTSPPIDGKANEALIKHLSKTFDIAKSKFFITKGLKLRKKTILVNESNLLLFTENISMKKIIEEDKKPRQNTLSQLKDLY
jgi:uncharacterized protein (TIGR00251 family)